MTTVVSYTVINCLQTDHRPLTTEIKCMIMDNNPNFERVDKYLNNELSEQERQELENQAAHDEDLSAELERQQAAHKVLDLVIAKNLKQQLEDLEEESKVVAMPRQRRFSLYQLAAAASVLLIIGFGTLFFLNSSDDPAALASAYYETPDLNTQRSVSADPNTTDALTQGLEMLNLEQYQEAITTLSTIEADNEQYIPAQYALGHAHYLAGQYQAAETSFTAVSDSGDFRYAEEGEWYALLACLAQAQGCSTRLQAITNQTDHTYYLQAQQIAEKINN